MCKVVFSEITINTKHTLLTHFPTLSRFQAVTIEISFSLFSHLRNPLPPKLQLLKWQPLQVVPTYNLTKPIPKAKRTLRTKATTTKSKLSPKPKPFKEASVDVYKTIGELSERRIGICNKLPANHPFQPPVIKPLTMLPPGVPIPSSSTQGSP